MTDYVPLIIVGAIAYYVLVVNPNFISELTARFSAPSSTPPGSPCMGTDANNQPCVCNGSTATSSVAYAYYGGGGGKKGKGKKGKKGKGGGGGGQAADNTPAASTCNCSACNQSTNTAPADASSLAKNIQKNVKKNIKNVTGNEGTADLNAFAGSSMANEGWGFAALQAYYRRGW